MRLGRVTRRPVAAVACGKPVGVCRKCSVNRRGGQAVEKATASLKTRGCGVRTTIDGQQTLRAKLDRDFRKYVILGACNPALADRALHAELEVGLLLPCNVIVYETGPTSSVVAALGLIAN